MAIAKKIEDGEKSINTTTNTQKIEDGEKTKNNTNTNNTNTNNEEKGEFKTPDINKHKNTATKRTSSEANLKSEKNKYS